MNLEQLEDLEIQHTKELKEAYQAGIDELTHSWNKAEQQLDGTAQGAVNCIEQFRNAIKALQDNK